MDFKEKKDSQVTRFLIGSFTLLICVSLAAFMFLGLYTTKVSEESIVQVGDLYMKGIDEQITSHFQTLIELKLEQAETVVKVVSPDIENVDELYDELAYRTQVRNFDCLAMYSEDEEIEMLYGERIHLADPEPFYESLRKGESKVAVGSDVAGNKVVIFGVSAGYPMHNGEDCIALLSAPPIDYISTMLGTEGEDSLMYSLIIRKDGTFIASDLSEDYPDYFTSLYDRYDKSDAKEIDACIKGLSSAMAENKDYSTILNLGGGRQQMRDLEKARQEALQANRAKSEFLSNMSHDIRTPMNAIVGMTAIATAHIDDTDQVKNCLRKITLSGRHLLGLINDVLDMSKIESGKMTLTSEKISLREVMEGVASIVQPQIKAKEQSFNIHIGAIQAEDVYCDSVCLNQVLLNLLSNSVKYTQDGGTVQLSLYQEEPSPRGDDYQIVLLDWKFPDMDGIQVAKQIRQIVNMDISLILISSYDWSDFEKEAREAGINGFLAKPLFKSTLYHGLKKYMGDEEAQEDIKHCLDSGMNAHTAKPINIDEVLSLLKKFIF